MFTKRHYEYLSDSILNDPNLTESLRRGMHDNLGKYFSRDFPNFNTKKWDDRWIAHYRST